MTGVSRQKQKLLTMKKLFETKTDEKHTITGNRLIEILGDYGIKAERKTIYDDIKTLCDSGMDIEITKDGHSNAYYLAQRLFQDEELYVLADAVASSRFLTQKKSKELLKKIQSLTSEHKAKDLRRMVYVSNRTKTFNEQIYYAINSIQEGIFSGLEIHFKYYEYTVEKRKQLRHGGEVYTVSPYSLVWENDNYYLVCYCEKHEKICRYRVDRMTQVTVTDIPRRELSEEEKENAKKDMEEMLDYIDKLGELDTSSVEPLSHVFPVHNVFREDEVNEHDGRENTLANAPERNGDSFVVPKTILGD